MSRSHGNTSLKRKRVKTEESHAAEKFGPSKECKESFYEQRLAPTSFTEELYPSSGVDITAAVTRVSSSCTFEDFLVELKNHRLNCASSVSDFKFNKKRVKLLSTANEVKDSANGILYWMSRDQRVQDNWALLYAQRLALKCETPLFVCFCLVPTFLDATIRQFDFMLRGLEEVEKECDDLDIAFHLLHGEARSVLPAFVQKYNIGGVITDFSPLHISKQWVLDVHKQLPREIAFCQVDAHNLVPCWETSDKQEYSARTIRSKIHTKLPEFSTEFPPVIKHPFPSRMRHESVDWKAAWNSLHVNMDVKRVKWASPGSRSGLQMLFDFCSYRLKNFADWRNDPTKDGISNLSPWIHFGQIAAQRCVATVNKYKTTHAKSVEAFVEEAVVRRELADNFCFYNSNYDKLEGGHEWAVRTLNNHRSDRREYIYTCSQLENSETHDDLWNSAQRQMVNDGKMHGFLRMYWAKKILEWTPSPEDALEIAIYLNDKYELDGRDPNGYVGCMWSIVGVHDQGWAERAVFGKIRYMNYSGCKRKFSVDAFVCRYGGRNHVDKS